MLSMPSIRSISTVGKTESYMTVSGVSAAEEVMNICLVAKTNEWGVVSKRIVCVSDTSTAMRQ